jgi:hypothetical protein
MLPRARSVGGSWIRRVRGSGGRVRPHPLMRQESCDVAAEQTA